MFSMSYLSPDDFEQTNYYACVDPKSSREATRNTAIQINYIEQRFKEFQNDLSKKMRECQQLISGWAELSCSMELDHETTAKALEVIQRKSKEQMLNLNELQNWRLVPDQDSSKSSNEQIDSNE
jgi:hypothetical protein